MHGIIRGKVYRNNRAPDIEIRVIPALHKEMVHAYDFSIKTIWGREVFRIETRESSVMLCPDACGNLPVYGYAHADILFFANTLSDLLGLLPTDLLPSLDKQQILRMLMMEPDRSGSTLLEGVFVANGDTVLLWTEAGIVLQQSDPQYIEKSEPCDFADVLRESLSWTKQYRQGEIGVTLSGGIDSAVIWAALLEIGIQPVALTLLFPGDMGVRQQRKIAEMREAVRTPWITVHTDAYTFDDSDVDPYRSLYASANNRLGILAASVGVSIVLGGVGGDELTANAGYEGTVITDEKKIPGYISELAVNEWNALPEPNVMEHRLIPRSALNTRGITGEVGVEQNMWSESIFCYPAFWHWSAAQPKRWGIHKQGFRQYLRERSFFQVSDTLINEDYSGVFLQGMRHFLASDRFTDMLANSQLARWQWIDGTDIAKMRNQPLSGYTRRAQYLATIYVLEKFLRWYGKMKGGEQI